MLAPYEQEALLTRYKEVPVDACEITHEARLILNESFSTESTADSKCSSRTSPQHSSSETSRGEVASHREPSIDQVVSDFTDVTCGHSQFSAPVDHPWEAKIHAIRPALGPGEHKHFAPPRNTDQRAICSDEDVECVIGVCAGLLNSSPGEQCVRAESPERQDLLLEAARWAQQNCQSLPQTQDHPVGLACHEQSLSDPVGGTPRLQAELLILDNCVMKLKAWTVLLFTNGFYAISRTGALHSFAWSPFTVILEEPSDPELLGGRPAFSVQIFAHDIGFVFAANGSTALEAENTRRDWMDEMVRTLRKFTKSLLPRFSLAVEPIGGKPSTANRILAGYLLLLEDDIIKVPYCELHAHSRGKGVLVLYENHLCENIVASHDITRGTSLSKIAGIDCSCFNLDRLRLCARTHDERDLWCRAIFNVQVKCNNAAPDPTQEDLRNYRESVLERVVYLNMLEAAKRIAPERNSVSQDDHSTKEHRHRHQKTYQAKQAPRMLASMPVGDSHHGIDRHPETEPDPDALQRATDFAVSKLNLEGLIVLQ
mmetsp:Transcript_64566/g.101806  ORF Transcript_64566/g.101806 Transcript_64566/m.101806 type:complete len:541 (-) Transcript_64566:74-1696(-)